MTKIWVAKNDTITCQSCRDMDGKMVSIEAVPPNPQCRRNECRCSTRDVTTQEQKRDHELEEARSQLVEKTKEQIDKSIDHPAHYGGADDPFEHVKVAIARGWDKDAFIYTVTKYLWRFGQKDGEPSVRDLKKARWYLDKKIELMEKSQR